MPDAFSVAPHVMEYIRNDVDDAMTTRANLFTAAGYVLKDGEWVDATTGRRMSPRDMRILYKCGDEASRRPSGEARWPWPYVPF